MCTLLSPHTHLYENLCILNANTQIYLGLCSVLLQKSALLSQVLHLSKQTWQKLLRELSNHHSYFKHIGINFDIPNKTYLFFYKISTVKLVLSEQTAMPDYS